MKRSVADLLVRRLLARRISKFLIQLIPVKPGAEPPPPPPPEWFDRFHTPETRQTLPPAELPGIYFEQPANVQARRTPWQWRVPQEAT